MLTHFPYLFSQLENGSSSEPDELSIILVSGSWRVSPYLDTVFKPIKDGFNNFVRGVGQAFEKGWNEFDETGSLKESTKIDMKDALFPQFIEIILIIIEVIMAIMKIVTPFLSIVSFLLKDVTSFIGPMIISIFSSSQGDDMNMFPNIFTIDSVIEYVSDYIGNNDGSKTKSVGPGTTFGAFFAFLGLAFSIWGIKEAKKSVEPVRGKKGFLNRLISPGGGLILSIAGCLVSVIGIAAGELWNWPLEIQLIMAIAGVIISFIGFGISGYCWPDAGPTGQIICVGGAICGIGGVLSGTASIFELG